MKKIMINSARTIKRRALLGISVSAVLLHTALLAAPEYDDKVLVIVNEDIITQSEFEGRKLAVMVEMQGRESELPENFDETLLDGMISDRLQMQEAERRQLVPTVEEINIGVQRYAEQQNLTVQQFIQGLAQQGQSLDDFKITLRDTISLSRLRDYYAQARVVVPDYEIDGFLAVNRNQMNDVQYFVAHLLIKDPVANVLKARQVRQQIIDTGDFESAVAQYSDGGDTSGGGVMGWRRPDQLPEVFVDALADTAVGGITPVLESPNGLHILKLIEMRGERTEIIQHKTRHILVEANTQVARSQAAKKLRELREQVMNGESFSRLARIHSDDSVSASAGGSLDWVTPGDMVREFEDMMMAVPLNEVSEPFSSQFGEHILVVEDRRKKNITDEMMRLRADGILRRQRADREFSQWVRQLRDQAYIEHVAKPSGSDS